MESVLLFPENEESEAKTASDSDFINRKICVLRLTQKNKSDNFKHKEKE